ncbi:MAG: hypothetical protein HFH81_10425 [Lachnospiraceae bacterium]|jgi:hypothetical protein|nr:hypothetical protein [Lachnospiraceae bacterium]
MKKRYRVNGAAIFILALFLTGCGKAGRLDEGNCPCVVRLQDIPREFKMLEENLQEQLEISVTLENITTERQYRFELNTENGFQQNASLNPGIYKVNYCSGSPYFLNMDIAAVQADLEVGLDRENEITVYIQNETAFSDLVWDMQPIREVMQSDKFSRQIQWGGQMIDLENILDYIEFSSDQTVRGYDQITLFNQEACVRVTLQNQTAQEASWKECELIKVQFERPNVIFGQGAKVGMPVREIVHAREGIYGTPDSLTGSILFAAGVDAVGIVYYDEASGDRLTLESGHDGKGIYRITYELAIYE